jgi:predicted alpha/beta superfamily hydrolase
MAVSMIQPGIELQYLHSEILHQDFELLIKLPWSYDNVNRSFPVLFALDANRSFPLYSTMSLIYETPGTGAEEIIIVGIGYKVDQDRMLGLAQWAALRTRDLTPVRNEKTEGYWKKTLSAILGKEYAKVESGGAVNFLRSLREEIIPCVEANYRVSSDRGLAGYSYGGLFTLYALFHAPELFKRYFAGSPTMWEQLFEYEAQFASVHADLPIRLFITTGGLESDLHEPVRRMIDRLQSRGYPGLEVIPHCFEDEGHSSAYAASVSRALRILYNYK